MKTTLRYIHCDICGEPSNVSPAVAMNFEEVLDEAVVSFGWHRVYSRSAERVPERHVCPNCWKYRECDVRALQR